MSDNLSTVARAVIALVLLVAFATFCVAAPAVITRRHRRRP